MNRNSISLPGLYYSFTESITFIFQVWDSDLDITSKIRTIMYFVLHTKLVYKFMNSPYQISHLHIRCKQQTKLRTDSVCLPCCYLTLKEGRTLHICTYTLSGFYSGHWSFGFLHCAMVINVTTFWRNVKAFTCSIHLNQFSILKMEAVLSFATLKNL